MKTKLKITMTVTLEYAPNPAYYLKEDRTAERMLAIDMESAKDSFDFFDVKDAAWEYKGEILAASPTEAGE